MENTTNLVIQKKRWNKLALLSFLLSLLYLYALWVSSFQKAEIAPSLTFFGALFVGILGIKALTDTRAKKERGAIFTILPITVCIGVALLILFFLYQISNITF